APADTGLVGDDRVVRIGTEAELPRVAASDVEVVEVDEGPEALDGLLDEHSPAGAQDRRLETGAADVDRERPRSHRSAMAATSIFGRRRFARHSRQARHLGPNGQASYRAHDRYGFCLTITAAPFLKVDDPRSPCCDDLA